MDKQRCTLSAKLVLKTCKKIIYKLFGSGFGSGRIVGAYIQLRPNSETLDSVVVNKKLI